MTSSKSVEWATPRKFAREQVTKHGINLDVCATSENAIVANYFSKSRDGLSRTWDGVVWMNPPYGREIKFWIRYAIDQILHNPRCLKIVCLLPARVDTAWFHDMILPYTTDITFIRGRLKFNDGKDPALFPSMLVVYTKPPR